MAKSSVNEVGTLSPLVEVKGVDSCWKKSMDSKQGCNVTLNRPQAFIQIHYNPQAILLMWIAKWSIFNTSIWNLLTWKRIYSSEKKNPFESQVLQKKLTMVNEHAGVNCLSTVLIICALPIWTLQGFCRRHGFNPCLRKIPWRNKWQPTPVFLPGKFHGQRRLVGYSLGGPKESDTTEWLSMQAHAPSEALGKNPSMCLPSLRWLLTVGQGPLAYGCITLISASIVTWPSSLHVPSVSLCLISLSFLL